MKYHVKKQIFVLPPDRYTKDDLIFIVPRVLELDISNIAESLGMQVFRDRGAKESKTLCPFHADTRPSLTLYFTGHSHYHCYACGAHGDVFDIVKNRKGLDFIEAARWLAEWANIPWPVGYAITKISPWNKALEIYSEGRKSVEFKKWASERGYTSEFLNQQMCVIQPAKN